VDVGRPFCHRYGTWIGYWTRVRSTLIDLHQDDLCTLRHGFWPQNRMDVNALEATRLLDNVKVCEEFNEDDHYIGPTSNHPPPSFRVVMDFHEGFMLILHLGDEIYAKVVWVAKSFFPPNFIISSPYFCQILVEYYIPTTCNDCVFIHYTYCDTNHTFRWRVDF
jgi:hypothetical protein